MDNAVRRGVVKCRGVVDMGWRISAQVVVVYAVAVCIGDNFKCHTCRRYRAYEREVVIAFAGCIVTFAFDFSHVVCFAVGAFKGENFFNIQIAGFLPAGTIVDPAVLVVVAVAVCGFVIVVAGQLAVIVIGRQFYCRRAWHSKRVAVVDRVIACLQQVGFPERCPVSIVIGHYHPLRWIRNQHGPLNLIWDDQRKVDRFRDKNEDEKMRS